MTAALAQFWRRSFWCLLALLGGMAGSVQAAAATSRLENADLRVTVTPATGRITVYDKANRQTWNQREEIDARCFTNVVALPGQAIIRFDTTFGFAAGSTNPSPFPAQVELRLLGRNLTLTTRVADTNQPVDSFDFLPPFQPVPGMSLVVPDFCDGHIYPCDLAAWPQYNLDSIRVLNFPMPWAGVVDLQSGAGYAVLFDTPYDAQLKLAAQAGLRAPQAAWNPEKGRFGYARSLTYAFTARGGYVALAKAFRAQAEAQGLVVKLDTKARTRPAITNLYGAPILWDFDDALPDTELSARGVTRALHHVERWDGAKAGLARLTEANRLGFITEEYDYYLAGPVDGKTQRYQDYHVSAEECLHDEAGNIPGVEGRWGMRCTSSYLPAAQRILPDRLRAFPQTGRYFDQLTQNFNGHDLGPRGGGSTEECWDPQHPKTRTEWVQDVDRFYQYAAQVLGLINGAELGKFHQVPFTEVFHGMHSWFWPWPDVSFPSRWGAGDTNAWQKYDRWVMNPAVRVPLWQLVFHDCTVASWYPWDGNDICFQFENDYQDRKDGFNLLSGTPAVFLVNSPTGSQYFHQPGRWLQSYRNTCKLLEQLADKEMVSHRSLTPDRLVQQTEWSDGTRVTVNFGTNQFKLRTGWFSTVSLDQFCFLAQGPWGRVLKTFDPAAGRKVTRMQLPGYAFDDAQTCAGQPVALAQRLTGPHAIRVNVDALAGVENVSFKVYPQAVTRNWNWRGTKVFVCQPQDGSRLREIPWIRTGNNGIQVSSLSGWIVLDVISEPEGQNQKTNQAHATDTTIKPGRF